MIQIFSKPPLPKIFEKIHCCHVNGDGLTGVIDLVILVDLKEYCHTKKCVKYAYNNRRHALKFAQYPSERYDFGKFPFIIYISRYFVHCPLLQNTEPESLKFW
jgi:hypothetical protein